MLKHFERICKDENYETDMCESYMVSKNALNALTTAQQIEFDQRIQQVTVSAVHPG